MIENSDGIIQLVKNNQLELAATTVTNKLAELKKEYFSEPWKLFEEISDVAKQYPEQAISLFLLLPPYLEVNLEIGLTHIIAYHHKIEKNHPAHKAYDHIKVAMSCFEKHIAGICPIQPRGIYPYNMRYRYPFNKMDQRCDEGIIAAIDQIFYLANLKYIELDEITRLEYQERQFSLRLKTPNLTTDNQERIDRLYDELCGNNGMNPHVKNINGDPVVLLALAKELRNAKRQLAYQPYCLIEK